MALISGFVPRPGAQGTFRSSVECGWAIREHAGKQYLHLETYGSNDRKIPGKVSQSLQLDESAARELLALLEKTFPSLRR